MFGLAGSKSVVDCRGPVPGGVVWDMGKVEGTENMAVAKGREGQKQKRIKEQHQGFQCGPPP